MNKIIVSKNKIICDDINVLINGKTISFNNDNEYLLEYMDDGDYKLKFIINGNIKLTEISFDLKLNIGNKYVIEYGELSLVKFYNSLSVLETSDVDLCNPMCKVDYHFANICRGNEHYTININHQAEKTRSRIYNRSVALKDSTLKFIINSNVSKKAIKSNIDQNTRIVTMGDADTKISSNRFIPIDDIEARHGSVIGTFDDDQVFYLMSKGINYNDTLKLLIKGYLLGNLEVDYNIRKRIIDTIETYWR